MIRRFQIFLGPRRFKAFVAQLAITGLASLALSVVDQDWVTTVQSLLLVVFIVGAAYLILGRLPREERWRWLAIIVPALLAIVIASFLLPHLTGLFLGAGIGWIVAGIFVFNSGGKSQHYRRAIKAMRKGDHDIAINEMTSQIKEQSDRAEHYRFRAELYRLAGDLHLARRDYRRMIELDDQLPVAYNGLAEVELQARNFRQALDAAQYAYELAPEEWVAAYNLGMIEDRLQESENALQHLQAALQSKIPDSRHRLLVHLYLLRAHVRLGNETKASEELDAIRRERSGLEEWQVIMRADEAAALREVLREDIELARALLSGEQQVSALMAEAVLMSLRRLIAWIAVFISVGLAAMGMVVFVLGVVIEFANGMTQPLDPYISPVAQLSLAGLCLSASMILLGFLLIGILLARQSRQYGAGYGEAYRLMQKLQFPQAIQLMERVLAGGKITPDLLMLLTSAYAYNGQLAKAQETADRAVRMYPGNAGAYMTLANGYRMQASYGEAAIALQTAAQISPDQPIVWAELGFVQQLAGEHDSAIESFKHAALYSMPSMYSVRVNYFLSRHYSKTGERENASAASERMMTTSHGLEAWKSTLRALEGTAYGSLLHYEIEQIEQALAENEPKTKHQE